MTTEKKQHIPSMVWAVFAFVPWILYWMLAGMGYTTAAILSGLGVSLAINGYRFAARKTKIMDTVSLVVLAAFAFVTLVLRSDVLVFYGGIVSDAALALMAWGSLLLGNPFTYDYAKEDWDEAFWDNPIFIKTNQIITAVWGFIFAVQVLIGGIALAMNLGGAARIILVGIVPRALPVLGIFFSTWFPNWYPQRAAAQQKGQSIGTIPDDVTGLQLIESMPLAFNAQAADGLEATIQFHLSGEGGGAGYLEIASGQCAFRQGEVDQPTLTIKSPVEVWTAVSRGELNGTEAFLSGAYQVEGEMSVLMRLDSLFGNNY